MTTKKIVQKLGRILALTLIIVMTFATSANNFVLAQDAPPTAPTAPSAPTAPEAPTAPTAPSAPTAPEAPTAPTAPTPPSSADAYLQSIAPTTKPEDKQSSDHNKKDERSNTGTSDAASSTGTAGGSTGNQTGEQKNDGQTGDTTVNTGDATNTAKIAATGNNNATVSPLGGTGSSASIVNGENGAQSSNSGSATIGNNNSNTQNNSAQVSNNLNQDTNTGKNSASKNLGNSTIQTGDANTSGTVITAVNTNVAGVAVSEFNVVDDHTGDLVLDFAANCITGCQGGSQTVANTGNGANSDNTASMNTYDNSYNFQNNEATVGSTLDLSSNTGKNEADKNTGGDSNIITGDANVAANVLTFANNNFAGNVVYGVVNVYGDLVGDIIFPEEAINACCGQTDTLVKNTSNGAGSENTGSVNNSNTDTTTQNNQANIVNNLDIYATTGENLASKNTDGSSNVTTGDTNILANVLNVANSNVDGGNWWLVIVNEAGNWVGKIMGAPTGSNMAGSEGTQFTVGENGEITAVNSGNGADSTNSSTVTNTNNATTVQNNEANIVNNVTLGANTGGNSASKNTGGDSSVVTGDANVIANMVNFVNNNVVGNGKLFVTVVNVFGTWMGDFVTPGTQKENTVAQKSSDTQKVGGSAQQNVSPTNTPTEEEESQTSISVTKKKTAGAATTNNNSNDPWISGQNTSSGSTLGTAISQNKTTVAAANLKNETAAKKVVNINLAWLILLIPCAILWKIRKGLIKNLAHTVKLLLL